MENISGMSYDHSEQIYKAVVCKSHVIGDLILKGLDLDAAERQWEKLYTNPGNLFIAVDDMIEKADILKVLTVQAARLEKEAKDETEKN